MENIEIVKRRTHTKASEVYVDVIFRYPGCEEQHWSIPIEYRRTGTHLADLPESEIIAYLKNVYEACDPKFWASWREEQREFWAQSNKPITRAFFDALADDFAWRSVKSDLPENPNTQRRIQDLKEFGYTIATDTSMVDPALRKKTTHHLLLPLPRQGITGYEQWSPQLRRRIIDLLGRKDVFENSNRNADSLLPDHKFPEIRWDAKVKRESLEDLTDEEIKRDFQLLNNQRNQQKRESCRQCYQSGTRPNLLGIHFFYEGGANWPPEVPATGKAAESGCVGCPWYDLEKWRVALNAKLSTLESEK